MNLDAATKIIRERICGRNTTETRYIMYLLKDAISEKLGIEPGECTEDERFSLEACRCIGACGLAPVMTVNDDVYGRLTVDQVDEILDKYINE